MSTNNTRISTGKRQSESTIIFRRNHQRRPTPILRTSLRNSTHEPGIREPRMLALAIPPAQRCPKITHKQVKGMDITTYFNYYGMDKHQPLSSTMAQSLQAARITSQSLCFEAVALKAFITTPSVRVCISETTKHCQIRCFRSCGDRTTNFRLDSMSHTQKS